jgi:hypothetical protein
MANPLLDVGQNPPPLRSPFIQALPAMGSQKIELVDELSQVEMMVSPPWARFFSLLVEQIGVPGPPGPSGAASPWVTDAYSATWTADITLGWNHQMTLTGNVAIAVPTGGTSGQPVLMRAIQDATGGRQITLAAGWKNARPDPGYQEALTSCIISGVFLDATTVFVLTITENIPA